MQHTLATNKVLSVSREPVDANVTEPVTLDDFKHFLKVSYPDDDLLLTRLLKEARQWVENQCGVSLIPTNVRAILAVKNRQELPYGPAAVKANIVIRNPVTGAAVQTGCFRLEGFDNGFITLVGYGQYQVEYTAGYNPVPQELRVAIMNKGAASYEHRGDELNEANVDYARIAKSQCKHYVRTTGF